MLPLTAHPYDVDVREQLDEYQPDLWRHLDQVPTLAPEIRAAVLGYFFELACHSQNIRNIELGRLGLLVLPRGWVLTAIEEAAAPLLAAGQEWEYRRLLEAYWGLDPALARRQAVAGQTSPLVWMRESSHDFLTWLDAEHDAL